MNLSYRVVGLLRNFDGTVTVTLRGHNFTTGEDTVDQCTVVLPNGSPAIAQLTIGRRVDATFTAV